jgi:hypothetical protein
LGIIGESSWSGPKGHLWLPKWSWVTKRNLTWRNCNNYITKFLTQTLKFQIPRFCGVSLHDAVNLLITVQGPVEHIQYTAKKIFWRFTAWCRYSIHSPSCILDKLPVDDRPHKASITYYNHPSYYRMYLYYILWRVSPQRIKLRNYIVASDS